MLKESKFLQLRLRIHETLEAWRKQTMTPSKKLISLLAGAVSVAAATLPAPALANNNNNNTALNQMAMQMYMQQQTNGQTQAILAQQQSIANYNAAQAAWAAQHTYVPASNVNYTYPTSYYSNQVATPVQTVNYAPNYNQGLHHEYHHYNNYWRR